MYRSISWARSSTRQRIAEAMTRWVNDPTRESGWGPSRTSTESQVRPSTVPIVTTAAVDRIIRRDDELKGQIVGPMMGAEWPPKRAFPNRIATAGDSIAIGGLTMTIRDVGAGESHADTIWQLTETAVFAGDLAYHNMHAYLADGHYGEWIETLDALHGLLADEVTLYVGHGPPGSKELLVQQRRYVEQFVDAVRRSAGMSVDDRSAYVTTTMHEILPNDRLLFLMQLSIEPVLATIRDEQDRSTSHS
jgi:glyoxylase-like metal-dependent hydrolase (beta-lactamase superfamily II)